MAAQYFQQIITEGGEIVTVGDQLLDPEYYGPVTAIRYNTGSERLMLPRRVLGVVVGTRFPVPPAETYYIIESPVKQAPRGALKPVYLPSNRVQGALPLAS